MLKNTLKEIKVRDYWKGTKAASLRWVALLGIWAVTGIAAIPFVIQYQADEPNRRAREEEKKRLEFEQDKERLAFQRILLEAQAKNKEWDRMDEVRTKYN